MGNVPIQDMRRTFNLGVGLIIVVGRNNFDIVSNHLDKFNEDHFIIGEVVDR